MNSDNLTFGRSAGTSFPTRLAQALRAQADGAMKAFGSTQGVRCHAGVLHSLASYVEGIGNHDQRLRALELCQPSANDFTPGRMQATWLGNVATAGKPAMDNSEALHELLACAVEDLAERLRNECVQQAHEVARLEKVARSVNEARDVASERTREAERLRALLTERDGELTDARERLGFFEALHANDEQQPGESPKGKREKVEPYVYRRHRADGGVTWLVGYSVDGQMTYKQVEDIEAARKRRDELIADGTIKPKEPVAA